jgi:Ubiquitin carboxyl-terminal hydrolase
MTLERYGSSALETTQQSQSIKSPTPRTKDHTAHISTAQASQSVACRRLSSWPQPLLSRPQGRRNLGNTCYLNVCIQLHLSIPKVVHLLNQVHREDCTPILYIHTLIKGDKPFGTCVLCSVTDECFWKGETVIPSGFVGPTASSSPMMLFVCLTLVGMCSTRRA